MPTFRHLDRVRMADRVAKAGCYLCLEDSGGLVDLDIVIEGEGRLVICDSHVKMIGQTIDLLDAKETRKLRTRIKNLEADKKALTEALRDKEDVISTLASYVNKKKEIEVEGS